MTFFKNIYLSATFALSAACAGIMHPETVQAADPIGTVASIQPSTNFKDTNAAQASQADDPVIAPTNAEMKMIAYMKGRGVNHFMILNKDRGQILYVVNNQITDFDAALTGKMKGNEAKANFGITPAGIFKLEAIPDSNSIGYKKVKGTGTYYSIHPVLDIQHRKERLASNLPEWQRISSGCINVTLSTIGRIRGFMAMSQTFTDDKSEKQLSGTFFAVLPEGKPVESIFKFPDFTPSRFSTSPK